MGAEPKTSRSEKSSAAKRPPAAKKPEKGFLAWLKRRHDPLTSLLLTIPIFLIYHLGILLPFVHMRNGVDFVSGLTLMLLEQSQLAYIGITLGYAVAIGAAVFVLRKRGKLRAAEWLPMLGESALLALVMSFTVGWATGQLFDSQIGGATMNPAEKLVMAAGAGFHEELIFRVLLFAGGTFLLTKVTKLGATKSALIAAFFSSVIFSTVHYVGPFGDAFLLESFVFRFLAGLFLAAVYRFRGFAVAVYTHAVYDVIVFFL